MKKKILFILTLCLSLGLFAQKKNKRVSDRKQNIIETEYNPMAESLKQFYARFRNIDQKRKTIFITEKQIIKQ